MLKRWQTHDALFDVNKPKKPSTPGSAAETPLTPRPGEELRWCAHDRRLLHELTRPDVIATFGTRATAFLEKMGTRRLVTLEQVAALRSLARRVSFARLQQEKVGRRAMKLGGEL